MFESFTYTLLQTAPVWGGYLAFAGMCIGTAVLLRKSQRLAAK